MQEATGKESKLCETAPCPTSASSTLNPGVQLLPFRLGAVDLELAVYNALFGFDLVGPGRDLRLQQG
jgi:hypothetical protein